jgi:DNA-binding NtrC family response regulator
MPAPRARVLVVDDAPDTLEVLERNLVGAGFVVATAASVREAQRHLAAAAFDAVVTDLKMPGAGGLELLRHVRELGADVAVIVISGYPTDERVIQAITSGAEGFLPKPFTDDELAHAVQAGLDRVRARRDHARAALAPPKA